MTTTRPGATPGTPPSKSPRPRLVRGDVEIGEEHEPVAQAVVLRLHRLLHLQQQLGLGPDFVNGGGARARGLVRRVGKSAAVAGARLHDDLVAALNELPRTRGRQRDAVFV